MNSYAKRVKRERNVQVGVALFVLAAVFTFWGTVGYVAWHFISKYW